MSDAVPIIVYTRTHCPLCDEAEETIRKVAAGEGVPVDIEFINVDTDEELRAKYGERVPYVYIDGRPAFKFEVDPDRLREKLAAAQG
ncbi:glutaredoxin family protein [Haloferax mediterranei ATCC 33500]|uniref:Glutaredoxin family protein n=1 Tax=Haloferax mediterranei (strain ATCC 33500 / DSM 1411 / JCM 8866 / NBRC 14739 / NCIMB 2177 / R-4) TaxID=523841 RepID=I3R1Y2_HALMT|nr:glutaredoxin family protein [Haloferax mediterranei]AFK18242.1 thioredoxin [Haloferax mediterranei ATCC 33500]AHZ22357.1 thioredoxin [Haloferax mediterranei ATCC 33500]EMA02487.1 thioredoxin [Haloferax mediterranei ATCC 33500]MDX5988330.1 glutaredoxin family protein [Haloferax mediterranei ATCC 33500]QCQ74764.1 glutaredoxin family protein [Haloferax mediterranei ATCC 33500]